MWVLTCVKRYGDLGNSSFGRSWARYLALQAKSDHCRWSADKVTERVPMTALAHGIRLPVHDDLMIGEMHESPVDLWAHAGQ